MKTVLHGILEPPRDAQTCEQKLQNISPLCDGCSLAPAVFFCLNHRLALCVPCTHDHHNPRGCHYVPAWMRWTEEM